MNRVDEAEIYANDVQQRFFWAPQKTKCWVGGRGSGKTSEIAMSLLRCIGEMPGSHGVLTCKTIKQLKTKTLKAIKKIWKIYGMIEGVHYVCWKRPHKSLKYHEPLAGQPDDFGDIIYWYNGTLIEIIAATQKDSARGGSFDWARVDEAAFFDEDFYSEVLAPSRRGNLNKWDSDQLHTVNFYTSMPYLKEQKWVLKYEKLAEQYPDKFFFMESTAYDNPAAWTEEMIEDERKQMPYLKFMVEFMNMRIGSGDSFYHNWDDDKHTYDRAVAGTNTMYRKSKPIHLSIDPGGWFTAGGLFQDFNDTEYMFDSVGIKEGGVADMADQIVTKYSTNETKTIYIYGDPRGNDKTALGKSAYEAIVIRFQEQGWTAIVRVAAYQTEKHEERYRNVNEILLEQNPNLPRLRIHKQHGSDAIISVKDAEVKGDFKKNKKKEADKKYPQEHATHYSDMIDYYLLQKYAHRFHTIDMMDNYAGIA